MDIKAFVHVCETWQDAALLIIKIWEMIARREISSKGRFITALSGGSTPAGLYDMHSKLPIKSLWKDTHIFLVDERFVPHDHPDSNYRLVKEHLADPCRLQSDSFHAMMTEGLTLEDAAQRYENELYAFFGLKPEIPQFDLILLGIGEDGHTASLFPESDVLKEKEHLSLPAFTNRVPHERITMTLPLINNAKHVIFYVTGKGKASIMKKLLESEMSMMPAAKVRPANGKLVYVIDSEAASALEPDAVSDHFLIKEHGRLGAACLRPFRD
jgi:6-phosphogluconolactonase